MSDIDYRGLGVDAEDNALHQPHIGVSEPEVRGEGDYGACHGSGSVLEKLCAEYGDDDKHGTQDDGGLEQRFLYTTTRAKAGLTAAENPSARIPHLQQDHDDKHHRDQYLRKIKCAFQLRFPSQPGFLFSVRPEGLKLFGQRLACQRWVRLALG